MAQIPTQIRTRIAPSPTGNLHVGTARAALFSELFAHQQGGRFIIRIEDTDRERSKPEYEANILKGLKWLGLQWDEGPDIGGQFEPYRQSQRTHLYRAAVRQLLESDDAYQVPDGQAIKLRVKNEPVYFSDLVRGDITVQPETWGGDFVIARSVDDPVFHLAVVVDDAAMQITHVIRGEDHLTNTARHILLQRALGLPQPQYAHLPLLLDEQRRKLSKRAGEVDLLAYREAGYLPEAMLNYLALLGWNPKDDTEYFTYEELLSRFRLDGVQKGGAIFSEVKLQSMNKYYLRRFTPEHLLERVEPFLLEAGYVIDDESYWGRAVALEQERAATLVEFAGKLQYFKRDWPADYPADRLVWRKSTSEVTADILRRLSDFLMSLSTEDFTEETLEQRLMSWIDETGQGRGDVLWPLRVALTGMDKSPGPFEVGAILGKEEVLARIHRALEKLS